MAFPVHWIKKKHLALNFKKAVYPKIDGFYRFYLAVQFEVLGAQVSSAVLTETKFRAFPFHAPAGGRGEQAPTPFHSPSFITRDAIRPLSETIHGMITVGQHFSQWRTAH